jgi:hypothetical protein
MDPPSHDPGQSTTDVPTSRPLLGYATPQRRRYTEELLADFVRDETAAGGFRSAPAWRIVIAGVGISAALLVAAVIVAMLVG